MLNVSTRSILKRSGGQVPTSMFSQIPYVLKALELIEKKDTICDVGCGYGKYGVLIREYFPNTKILDAVEGFEGYLGPIHKIVYDKVIVDKVENLALCYDVFLLIDILEHFPMAEGIKMVRNLKGRKIIATPSKWDPQSAEFGNELEIHKSLWGSDDLITNLNAKTIMKAPESWVAIV